MRLVSAVLMVLSLVFASGCADSTPTSEQPIHNGGDNDAFVEVTAAELAALSPGAMRTVDLRPEGAAFAVHFDDLSDLDRVWVVDYDEATAQEDGYVLATRAPLAEGQVAGTVVFGHGDMRVLADGDRGCVCVRVCCWGWRCYCAVEK